MRTLHIKHGINAGLYIIPDTCSRIQVVEQLVSVYMSTDTCGWIQVLCSVLLADTSVYKWIQFVPGLHVSGVNAA